jgi:uncharacterized protein YbjT (DUF2867 family)
MSSSRRHILCLIFACSLLLGGCAGNLVASEPEIVLVGGATGRQGSAVTLELLERGYRVRALTRNPEGKKAVALAVNAGVELFQGNYADPESLARAMQGVTRVFFYSGFSRNELAEGKNVIAAAQAAGIEHLIYSTGAAAEPGKGIPGAKMSIELAIVDSGLTFTVFRPVAFMENLDRMQKMVAKKGIVDSRDPERMLHFIAVRDIGLYVGEAFANPARWANTAINIAGDRMTVAEYVATVGKVMGRPINYDQQPLESYLAAMPKPLRPLFRWYENEGYEADVAAARAEFPQLTTLEGYLRATGWEDLQE